MSKLALGTWWPPTSEKGLWFYAGLVALLLGNLLVTPYFTKPVDALAYSVPAIIGLLAVNSWAASKATDFDRFLWTVTLAYLALVASAGILSIALKDSASEFRQKFSRSTYQFSDLLGGPRPVCSAVFLFALVTFHRDNAREYLWIGASWLLFIGLRPLETLAELWSRLRAVWTAATVGTRLGKVVGHQLPNISLIEEDHVAAARYGSLLLARLDDGSPGMAMALDHVGYVDGRWLRAIELETPIAEEVRRNHQPLFIAAATGSAFQIQPTPNEFDPKDKPWAERDRLLGLVALSCLTRNWSFPSSRVRIPGTRATYGQAS